ncbi:hypothetical protein EFP84_18930 [Leptospira kmetyi]|uniref:Nucleoside 2-deoxyribosyltransferase n=1 Tax=Leptospira kmetyi TaxID=408139 RepID=A0AAD0XQU4_9LEPT|nr:hypothetical protein [Leptospira kmetyi]AYV57714.1 hypothetical protein EFP84_18930 [Leptospira kmetyi]
MNNWRGIYISEEELREKLNKDEKVFFSSESCYILLMGVQFIDNTNLTAMLGRCDGEQDYINTFSDLKTYSYFTDYEKGKFGYFTFDGIKFYKIASFYHDNAERAYVKLQEKNINKFPSANKAFMIMPFRFSHLNELYFNTIKPVITSLGIEIKRSDDFNDNDVITETIISQIEESQFIVVEASEENKNTFFEMGYAAALGKEIVTLVDKTKKFDFFDRSHIRYIAYDQADIEELKIKLKETILTIKNRIVN